MKIKNWGCVSIVMFLFGIILFVKDSQGASAIAYDAKTGSFGFSSNKKSVHKAKSIAMARCLKRGRGCRIVLTCGGPGFGSIYSRRGRGAPAWGGSCGARTEIEAIDTARKYCELQVAKNIGAVPRHVNDLPWKVIRRKLLKHCGGGGNCRCGNRKALWKDVVR